MSGGERDVPLGRRLAGRMMRSHGTTKTTSRRQQLARSLFLLRCNSFGRSFASARSHTHKHTNTKEGPLWNRQRSSKWSAAAGRLACSRHDD
jgi:hypothetical protein